MSRKRLGDLLVERGFLTPEQLEETLKRQSKAGKRLGDMLVDEGLISEDQLTEVISERLSIPRVSLDTMIIDPSVIQRVPVDLARRYTIIPVFAIGNTLTLAMADPLNFIAIDDIKYRTGAEIKRAVSTISEIKKAIDEYYSVADSLRELMDRPKDPLDIVNIEEEDHTAREAETPIVKLVNLIISKAVKDRASDVHIEPDETALRVRYRFSGAMDG